MRVNAGSPRDAEPNLVGALGEARHLAEATKTYEDTLRQYRELEGDGSVATSYGALGVVASLKGRSEQGVELLDKSLGLFERRTCAGIGPSFTMKRQRHGASCGRVQPRRSPAQGPFTSWSPSQPSPTVGPAPSSCSSHERTAGHTWRCQLGDTSCGVELHQRGAEE